MIFAPIVSIVPTQAASPALIAVGIMMISSFKEIKWDDIEEAIPAFFAAIFMALNYSISYGIAGGFIFYVIVKCAKGKVKEISPVVWVASLLFIANFAILAVL
jgi:AGZA family xanthine/uracil permease-like MFS transporter